MSDGNLPVVYTPQVVSAIRKAQAVQSGYVSHLSAADVRQMVIAAASDRRHGRRNAALISVIFDGALRVSEALGIRRVDLEQTPDGWLVHIKGKTGTGVAAVSGSIVNELLALCYDLHRAPTDKIFQITRSQAYRVVVKAYEKSGVRRPGVQLDGVGCVHVLRHSGALARLAASGNPQSVQHQLRHKSPGMTLRYLRTQQSDESLVIQQGVNPW